ncbi:MAG: hypothetical protein AAGE43_02150 [Pseudomonadota bacterium]
MSLRRGYLVLFLLPLLALAGACSAATPAADAVTGDESADIAKAAKGPDEAAAGERLLGQPPEGWRQTGATNTKALRRASYVPEDEAAGSEWIQQIVFEAMVLDPLPDPIEFIDTLSADRDRDCGTFEQLPTFAGDENGYPTAVFLMICHKDRESQSSEVMLMKTIQGKEAFYLVSRARRGEPIPEGGEAPVSEEEIAGWALFLRSIGLCDDGRAEHPCPAPVESVE